MMTMKQQHEYLEKLPQELREKYGFRDWFDFSKYECIHKNGFDYYPELDVIIVNNIPVHWQTGKEDLCEIDLDNPKHLKQLVERVRYRFYPNLVGVIYKNRKGRLTCILQTEKPLNMPHKIPVDGTYVYYRPADIDVENDSNMKLLAECMFIAKRYDTFQIFPYKDEEPEFWGDSL